MHFKWCIRNQLSQSARLCLCCIQIGVLPANILIKIHRTQSPLREFKHAGGRALACSLTNTDAVPLIYAWLHWIFPRGNYACRRRLEAQCVFVYPNSRTRDESQEKLYLSLSLFMKFLHFACLRGGKKVLRSPSVRLEKFLGPVSGKSPRNNSSFFSNLFLPDASKQRKDMWYGKQRASRARVHGIYINLEVSISMKNGSGRDRNTDWSSMQEAHNNNLSAVERIQNTHTKLCVRETRMTHAKSLLLE